jgi:hypothetical protein
MLADALPHESTHREGAGQVEDRKHPADCGASIVGIKQSAIYLVFLL